MVSLAESEIPTHYNVVISVKVGAYVLQWILIIAYHYHHYNAIIITINMTIVNLLLFDQRFINIPLAIQTT